MSFRSYGPGRNLVAVRSLFGMKTLRRFLFRTKRWVVALPMPYSPQR
nr:MAG TPA: hypothetical protein [Caudoviricetes sp.]